MSDSSLAYQGYGRGVDIDMIQLINAWAMDGIQPDITVYVKVDFDTAFSRLAQREVLTSFEQEKRDFFERIIGGFEAMYHNRADVIVVDGTQSPEAVVAKIIPKIMQVINAHEIHDQGTSA
jgi:dTMP kinase